MEWRRDRASPLADRSSFVSDRDPPISVDSFKQNEKSKHNAKLAPNIAHEILSPLGMKITDIRGCRVEPSRSHTDIKPRAVLRVRVG